MRIAIPGGIGLGKSTVSEILINMGYSVFSCDDIYFELLIQRDFAEKLNTICSGVTDADGRLDRNKFADAVFSNKAKLRMLDNLTHAIIMDTALERMNNCVGLIFCEVPLLFENEYERYFDKVIVVIRDLEERITSVENRNNMTREEVVRKINNQFDYYNSDLSEYYIIENNLDIQYLKEKLIDFLADICL